MTNLIKDISTLTDVTETTLNKFTSVCTYCIGHAVHEADCLHEDITKVDIGFGELHIKVDEETIKYRFVPSKELEQTLVKTITKHTSPIITKLETNLQEKIDRTYKELL